jgi:hypothetical protein
MNHRMLSLLYKVFYRPVVTTGFVFLAALVIWLSDGAPKHVLPPASVVAVPVVNTPHLVNRRKHHLGFKHDTGR